MKVMFDFCSGFGGASSAFENACNWQVERFENNLEVIEHHKTPPTHHVDLMDDYQVSCLMFKHSKVDLIWASPPCYDFSMARVAPRGIAAVENRLDDYEPDTSLVERCYALIEELSPQYWVIENVIGSIRYLTPILGEPRQIIGPFVLWGNFPYLGDVELDPQHKKNQDKRWDPLRSNYRAEIPLELSQALKDAITNQTTLFHF